MNERQLESLLRQHYQALAPESKPNSLWLQVLVPALAGATVVRLATWITGFAAAEAHAPLLGGAGQSVMTQQPEPEPRSQGDAPWQS